MARPILFHELTREQLSKLAPDALLILPLGATEQHGPHLPVGTDAFAVEHVARGAAREIAEHVPVVVAPTLPFGSSHHHIPFGGTLSLATETYYRVLCDLLGSLVDDGFGRIFMLNGHGGNHELAQLAARDVALQHPARIATASYWDVARQALLAEEAHVSQKLPGHAGGFETSLVLALRPELVVEQRPHRDAPEGTDPAERPTVRAEAHGWWQEINGFTDSPDRATAAMGQRYLDVTVRAVADAFLGFFNAE